MNKKGILGLVIVIVVAIGIYMVWGNSDTAPATNTGPKPVTTVDMSDVDAYAPVTKDSTDSTLLTQLKKSSVLAAETGTRVALSNGTAKFTDGDVKGTITLGDVAVETNVGGTSYAVAPLSVNSGGSSTFKYVVLFENKNGTWIDRSYGIVGDRVNVTGVRADVVSDTKGVNSIVVSVSFMDHDKGEALSSTPSVPRTKIFVVENGEFNSAKELVL